MKAQQKRRLIFVLVLGLGSALATALTLYALNENLLYFYTPSQVAGGEVSDGASFNLGGMVVTGSVKHATDGASVSFELQDQEARVLVAYTGLLPDLFREGQGIVATGKLSDDGIFMAYNVLAKHDENYMPAGMVDLMKRDKPLSIPQ